MSLNFVMMAAGRRLHGKAPIPGWDEGGSLYFFGASAAGAAWVSGWASGAAGVVVSAEASVFAFILPLDFA